MAITVTTTIQLLNPADYRRKVVQAVLGASVAGIGVVIWSMNGTGTYPNLVIVFIGAQGLSLFLLSAYDWIGHHRVKDRLKEYQHMPPQLRGLAMLGDSMSKRGSFGSQDPLMFIKLWGWFLPFLSVVFFLGDDLAMETGRREITSYSVVGAVALFWVAIMVADWKRTKRQNTQAEQAAP